MKLKDFFQIRVSFSEYMNFNENIFLTKLTYFCMVGKWILHLKGGNF